MTRMDKHRAIFPSGVGTTPQQKRHPTQSAFSNGGADVRDGSSSLKPGHCLPCLSGTKQGILPIFGLFCGF